MKKFLFIGLFSLLACTAEVNAASTDVLPLENVAVAYASEKPKTITRGDRVIIIYKDGTTIVVDKDGDTTRVEPKPKP